MKNRTQAARATGLTLENCIVVLMSWMFERVWLEIAATWSKCVVLTSVGGRIPEVPSSECTKTSVVCARRSANGGSAALEVEAVILVWEPHQMSVEAMKGGGTKIETSRIFGFHQWRKNGERHCVNSLENKDLTSTWSLISHEMK